jgi:Protein of unknown function (DUF3800)
MANFSDYIVYADESGDHNLVSINPQNPVFVLVFAVFKKSEYIARVVPAVQSLKFKYWGHDGIVLHGHEIRKQHGDFRILINREVEAAFLADLSVLMQDVPVTIIAAAIDKSKHSKRYTNPTNPYETALTFCMERLHRHLKDYKQTGTTHVLFERRGAKEDQTLELQFRRVSDGQNAIGKMPNLDVRFMDKKHNSSGLQVADLVAHPIARNVIDPAQPNRAYEIVLAKMRKGPVGQVKGYGLKVFP